MAKPHVIMVSFPALGHVIPLLKFAQHLAKQGSITITFINTDLTHSLVLSSLSEPDNLASGIRLVSVPDGLEPGDRHVPGKLLETVHRLMPARVEEVIQKINGGAGSDEDRVTCVVYDSTVGRIGEVARKFGIGSVVFFPAAAALLVLSLRIPRLIKDGIVDDEGTPLTTEPIELASGMVAIAPSNVVWHRAKPPTLRRLIFAILTKNNPSIESSDFILCNSAHPLEPGPFTVHHSPSIIPIGPLLAEISTGHFHPPDAAILPWLDRQPRGSVIYIAFGSTAALEARQLRELAQALELTGKPFLWASRAGDDSYPEGFVERTSSSSARGRIVRWAPQEVVLRHGSVGCFVSHCGWNSTMESVGNGVPMVCWPCMADQFMNEAYVCDVWGVGVRLGQGGDGDSGVITCEEIKERIEEVMDEGSGFKERALRMKEMVWGSVSEKGGLYGDFLSWVFKA